MNRITLLATALIFSSQLSANTPNLPADMVPQKYTGIDVSTPASSSITYGSSFEVTFEGLKRNGKKKIIKSGNHKFDIQIEGGWLKGNTVYVTSKPEKLGLYGVKVKIIQNGFNHVADSLFLPLDFKQKLTIDFSGKPGISGEDQRDRLTTPLIGRDGRDGRSGESGTDGTRGNDISVNIVSVYNKEIQSNMYILEVKDLSSGKTYYFNWITNSNGIEINTCGGNGGDGGDGGSGGNGKDGEYIAEKNKLKEAGSGGNGGDGGNGGNGGAGGNIDLFIAENAFDLLRFITVQNSGGYAGRGGWASEKGGTAGRALPCQHQPANGYSGTTGSDGNYGKNGSCEIHR